MRAILKVLNSLAPSDTSDYSIAEASRFCIFVVDFHLKLITVVMLLTFLGVALPLVDYITH